MIRKSFLLVLAVFLTSCALAPSSVLPPTEEFEFRPLSTATLIVLRTPTAVTPTATAVQTPVTDPGFFHDDFTGVLDAEWIWLRENPVNWSLITVPGSLQIQVEGGYIPAHNYSNLLLRPAPDGNFQIETQIFFNPQANFQFAGLIIYESDSNFIQAGRAFCSSVDCIGEGLYMNHYNKGLEVEPDFGQGYTEIDPILLRLSRRENVFTFEASTDGKVWFIIGSHTSDIDPRQIGLVTGQNLGGPILPAAFEYFEVRSLP
jgi:beta-xylosidase